MDPIENKQYSYKFILTYILLSIFFSISLQSQEKNIEIKSAGSFDRNESLFPKASINKREEIILPLFTIQQFALQKLNKLRLEENP